MRKEKVPAAVNLIIMATALFNVATAGINLWVTAAKSAAAPAPAPAAVCGAPAAPQVIQYLNMAPVTGPDKEKEPPRPAGQ